MEIDGFDWVAGPEVKRLDGVAQSDQILELLVTSNASSAFFIADVGGAANRAERDGVASHVKVSFGGSEHEA